MSKFSPERLSHSQAERNLEKPSALEDVENWLKSRTDNPRAWVDMLPGKLRKNVGEGSRLYLGGNVLYAVNGDHVVTCNPFYFEGERSNGSPYRWNFITISEAPADAPAAVLRVLRPLMEAAAAAKAAAERAQKDRLALADRMRPILEPRLQGLSARLQAIGDPDSAITLGEEGFYPRNQRWNSQPYTAENVDALEVEVQEKERIYQEQQAFRADLAGLQADMALAGITATEDEGRLKVLDGTTKIIRGRSFPVTMYFDLNPAGLIQLKEFIQDKAQKPQAQQAAAAEAAAQRAAEAAIFPVVEGSEAAKQAEAQAVGTWMFQNGEGPYSDPTLKRLGIRDAKRTFAAALHLLSQLPARDRSFHFASLGREAKEAAIRFRVPEDDLAYWPQDQDFREALSPTVDTTTRAEVQSSRVTPDTKQRLDNLNDQSTRVIVTERDNQAPVVELDPVMTEQVVQAARLYQAVAEHCVALAKMDLSIDRKWADSMPGVISRMQDIIHRAEAKKTLNENDQIETTKLQLTFENLFNREKQFGTSRIREYKGQIDRWREQWANLPILIKDNAAAQSAIDLKMITQEALNSQVQQSYLRRLATGERDIDVSTLITSLVDQLE